MMTEKTKTIMLIIGILLACLLLIQGISLGVGDTLNVGSLQIDISSYTIPELAKIMKASLNPF